MSVLINASTTSGLTQTADNSGTLELQSNGTTQLTVSSTGAYGQIKSGTAVASTSGTSIDFTSIPSWVKRITVMFSNVSTNGGDVYAIQIGSGSITSTGYLSSTSYQGVGTGGYNGTAAFYMWRGTGSEAQAGTFTICLVGGSTYVGSGVFGYSSAQNYTVTGGGTVTLSGVLDRVRITTTGGTNTFDAGSINILYEG